MPIRTIKRLDVAAGGRFEVRADAARKSGELLIYGDIGESWWAEESITAKGVIDALAGIDADLIDVRINSFGGSVADGLAIYNALRRHRAAIATHNDGVAFSAASLILMAGDERRSAENALTMIHAPWGRGIGNARELRDLADTLDKYAEAMAGCYARETGLTRDQALALLKDGDDHYYTAEEALAAGLIDTVDDALPIAAHFDLSRYPNLPPPAAAFSKPKVTDMPIENTPKPAPASGAPVQNPPVATPAPAAAPPAPSADNVAQIEAAAQRRERERLAERNAAIQARYARHMQYDGVPELYARQLADPAITVEAAANALLDHLGEQSAFPIAGRPVPVTQGMDERDKFRVAASSWLAQRMGMGTIEKGNELRGLSLSEIAARSLRMAGKRPDGMTRSELASVVLAAHTSSDFPYLLQDAANKKLQAAYNAFPQTWRTWIIPGEVADFKTVNLIRMGSFNSLDTIPEMGEYTQGTISEEREQLTAATKGKFIQLSRQMIINDDMQGFARRAMLLGNAAARTINADVYGEINTNGNMSDGTALFHADHANLAGSGGAISVATLGAGRAAMRKQTAPGSNATEYLNIMPRYLLVPVVLEDHARTVLSSENDTDTAGSRKRNPIRDWGPLEVVSDPYLDAGSTTAWYLVADPMQAPLVEAYFLDGQQTPYTDSEAEWITDAIRWKVRLDYGVKRNDYRGGYKNAGG